MKFIASPYSATDPKLVGIRYSKVMALAAHLTNAGERVFSPILHCHEMAARHNLPTHAEYWLDYNRHMLELSDGLIIAAIPGYRESIGVAKEISVAREMGLPIEYWTEHEDRWKKEAEEGGQEDPQAITSH